MFFDPLYFLFVGPSLILMLYAQWKVKKTFSQYSEVRNMFGMPGWQVAQRLLTAHGLSHVRVEPVGGQLTDHYDPGAKVVRLSEDVYNVPSVAAMGIVAHEVGHVVQEQVGYAPMRLRAGLVPVANLGSNLAYVLFLIGILIQSTGLVWLGVAFFTGAVAFALVTMPVEWDASNRARTMLRNMGLVTTVEYNAVNAVLNAAALTYLAGLLQAVGQLLYYVLIATGMSRREE